MIELSGVRATLRGGRELKAKLAGKGRTVTLHLTSRPASSICCLQAA